MASPTPSATGTCDSCGMENTPVAPAMTVFYEIIPGRFNCVDPDACFEFRFRDILPTKKEDT